MRSFTGMIIFISMMVFMDIYIISVGKFIFNNHSSRTKNILLFVYITLAVLAILCFILFAATELEFLGRTIRTYIFALAVMFFISKLIAISFFFLDDIRRIIQWVFTKVFNNTKNVKLETTEGINRSAFLSWLGFISGGGLISTMLYGFSNKYNFEVKNINLKFDELPLAFKGLKVVQISDAHSGSFLNKEKIAKGVEKIKALNADLILFTGDIVNDYAEEMGPYIDLFQQIKAPMGVYAILGNHDYGIYKLNPQDTPQQKVTTIDNNRIKIKNLYQKLGWVPLLNEHVILEKGNDKIALIGIENWSRKDQFPSYGNMQKATEGIGNIPFKILMSHDPSHWQAQIVKGAKFDGHKFNFYTGLPNQDEPQIDYSDINLTLSGHTHGMQFGFEIPGLKWSPVQYAYKEWAGLYEVGNQKLYVNRGFGCLGYPGRVGILPEITNFTLE